MDSRIADFAGRTVVAAAGSVAIVSIGGLVAHAVHPQAAAVTSIAIATVCVVAFVALVRKQLRQMADEGLARLASELAQVRAENALGRRQIEGLLAVYGGLGVRLPLPLLGGFSISADMAHILIDEMLARRPVRICEFGSGVSSVLIGTVARTLSEADGTPRKAVAFDHMAEYADRTRALLRSHGLDGTVGIICAPIEAADTTETGTPRTYARDQLREHTPTPVDLLFVDGPPWSEGSAGGRYEAVLAIADRLAPDAVVIFDDARRDRDVVARTARALDVPEPQYIETEKGTAIIRLVERNTSERAASGKPG